MSIYAPSIKHEPYWWEAVQPGIEMQHEIPAQADVVIVGAGYAGLCAALQLAEGGAHVVIVEAEKAGTGASTRNGGAIGATLRYSFSTLIKNEGLERAKELYSSAAASREFVFELIGSRGFDCDISRCGRFYGAHKAQDCGGLARDMELRQRHLGSDAVMVDRSDQRAYVGTDQYFGGRLQREDGHLHPAKYHRALLNAVIAAGATVVDRTRATKVLSNSGFYDVTTTRGVIKAGQVVMATNAYTGKEFGWFQRRLIPIQSQIIATEQLSEERLQSIIPDDHQIGDTCKLHNYFRRSPDRTRILFGGRSGAAQVNDFGKSGLSLYRRMTGLFPQLQNVKITHTWGGFIAFSFDHTPHMTQHEGIHYIGGCCGSGVAMMSYLGHQTGRKVLGTDYDPAFDRPMRSQPLYSGNPWFMPAIIYTLEMRDRFRI